MTGAQRQGTRRAEFQGLRASSDRSRPAITRASRLPGCSAPARPEATPPPITCACSARPITALPPALRRKLMITCDGAGASHALVKELDRLASRHGYQVTYSVGWELGAREKAAIGKVPGPPGRPRSTAKARSASAAPMMPAQDPRCAHRGLLDRRSARHRADRAAARGPGRRPAQGLAQDDAGLRPPRAAAPRRAAVPVRGRRRLALLPVGRRTCPPRPGAGAASAPTSTPPTASTPASRTSSAPARTPASDISPRTTTG